MKEKIELSDSKVLHARIPTEIFEKLRHKQLLTQIDKIVTQLLADYLDVEVIYK